MENVNATREGFKFKHYPEKRKKYVGPGPFQWVNDTIGIVAKMIFLIHADRLLPEDVCQTRKFAMHGIAPKPLENYFRWRMPEIFPYYGSKRGKSLTGKIITNRIHKGLAYDYREKVRGGLSGEHYTRNKKLRPLIFECENLYNSGKVITLTKMEKIGKKYVNKKVKIDKDPLE